MFQTKRDLAVGQLFVATPEHLFRLLMVFELLFRDFVHF